MVLDRTEIADQLRDDINTGKYPVDAKLPSYRHLAAQFGAAPNTVGEAVRILASEGLVQIRPNSGAVVCSPEEATLSADDFAALLRTELTAIRSELRETRTRLDDLDDRVTGLLAKLGAGQSDAVLQVWHGLGGHGKGSELEERGRATEDRAP